MKVTTLSADGNTKGSLWSSGVTGLELLLCCLQLYYLEPLAPSPHNYPFKLMCLARSLCSTNRNNSDSPDRENLKLELRPTGYEVFPSHSSYTHHVSCHLFHLNFIFIYWKGRGKGREGKNSLIHFPRWSTRSPLLVPRIQLAIICCLTGCALAGSWSQGHLW